VKRSEFAKILSTLLVAACFATVALVASGRDGNVKIPNGMQECGGIFKSSPGTIPDGGFDTLHLDSAGNLKIVAVGSGVGSAFRVATYDYAFNFAGVNGVCLQVQGSGTKLVRIKLVFVNPSATDTLTLNVCSSAATAGTSQTLTAGSHDSTDAAATAVVKTFTVAPTPGTSIAAITPTLALTSSNFATVTFGDNGTKEVTLNGSSQFFTVTGNAAATLVGGLSITEE
jgi:hypothetical protein